MSVSAIGTFTKQMFSAKALEHILAGPALKSIGAGYRIFYDERGNPQTQKQVAKRESLNVLNIGLISAGLELGKNLLRKPATQLLQHHEGLNSLVRRLPPHLAVLAEWLPLGIAYFSSEALTRRKFPVNRQNMVRQAQQQAIQHALAVSTPAFKGPNSFMGSTPMMYRTQPPLNNPFAQPISYNQPITGAPQAYRWAAQQPYWGRN